MLSEQALSGGRSVEAYAYARTGYHRGLDALRRAGWKGQGPIPWEHVPNRGFLRALAALSRAAGAIGERDEQQRCATFLGDSDPRAALSSGWRERGAAGRRRRSRDLGDGLRARLAAAVRPCASSTGGAGRRADGAAP